MKFDWNRKVTRRELSQVSLMVFSLFSVLLMIQLGFYPNEAPKSITVSCIIIGGGFILGWVAWIARVK